MLAHLCVHNNSRINRTRGINGHQCRKNIHLCCACLCRKIVYPEGLQHKASFYRIYTVRGIIKTDAFIHFVLSFLFQRKLSTHVYKEALSASLTCLFYLILNIFHEILILECLFLEHCIVLSLCYSSWNCVNILITACKHSPCQKGISLYKKDALELLFCVG